jgi:hypothetical protein
MNRWVAFATDKVPPDERTLWRKREEATKDFCRPSGTFFVLNGGPSDESLGYFRSSLRDFSPGKICSWRTGHVLQKPRPFYDTNQLRIAFCTCNRFSAWLKIVSAFASNVASSISFPRYAGRQCITSAPGLACFTRF